MAELDSTNVKELRRYFEAKEAFIEAEELKEQREEMFKVEDLSPQLESEWRGVLHPDSPVGEGSGLTEIKEEVPLLFCAT